MASGPSGSQPVAVSLPFVEADPKNVIPQRDGGVVVVCLSSSSVACIGERSAIILHSPRDNVVLDFVIEDRFVIRK